MKIKCAQTAGFCMGVRRAMEIVLDLARTSRSSIYTDGPLIHNPQIITLLEERGIKTFRTGDCPGDGVIVIRAHGVSPRRRRELKNLGMPLRDATCPDVAKVQALVKKHAGEGYDVVIVGDRGHAEVEGLLGFSDGRGRVVSDPGEARALPELEKVCVVAQTTQDVNLYEEVAGIIGERSAVCVVGDTICRSTKRRQKEAVSLAKSVDTVIVVGGRNSANTARLARICENEGIKALHIETMEDLLKVAFRGLGKIGITAGASTPNWLIERVVERIKAIRAEEGGVIQRLCAVLGIVTVRSYLLTSLAAVSLYVAACPLQGVAPRGGYAAALGFLIICLHLVSSLGRQIGEPRSEITQLREYYRKNRAWLTVVAAAAGIAAVAVAGLEAPSAPAVFCVLIALGLSGRVGCGRRGLPARRRPVSIRGVCLAWDLYIPAAWITAIVIVPRFVEGLPWAYEALVACGYVFGLIFIRVTLRDIRSINADTITGKETIATMAGKHGTKMMMGVVIAAVAGLLVTAPSPGSLRAVLAVPLFYILLYRFLYRRRYATGMLLYDFLDNGQFFIAGAGAAAWLLT